MKNVQKKYYLVPCLMMLHASLILLLMVGLISFSNAKMACINELVPH